MAETIQLEIVTPERLVVSEPAEYIEIPGETGYLGVLPGHAPLITELAPGELTYRNGNQTKRLAVAWGFAEVLQTKVTILAEAAEKALAGKIHNAPAVAGILAAYVASKDDFATLRPADAPEA